MGNLEDTRFCAVPPTYLTQETRGWPDGQPEYFLIRWKAHLRFAFGWVQTRLGWGGGGCERIVLHLTNLWYACPKWYAAFHAVQIFLFLLPDQPLYIVKNMYIYTYLTLYRLYVNYRCYQITLQWNIFTQIGAVRSLNGYLTLRRRSGSDWAKTMWHCTKRLAVFFLNRKCQQLQLLPNFIPYRSPVGGYY